MLSLLRRKPKAEVEALAPVIDAEPVEETVAAVEAEPEPEPVRRWKQQNIKASEDCCATFAGLAKAQGLSKSELFEDMVVERLETLKRQGIAVEIA